MANYIAMARGMADDSDYVAFPVVSVQSMDDKELEADAAFDKAALISASYPLEYWENDYCEQPEDSLANISVDEIYCVLYEVDTTKQSILFPGRKTLYVVARRFSKTGPIHFDIFDDASGYWGNWCTLEEAIARANLRAGINPAINVKEEL